MKLRLRLNYGKNHLTHSSQPLSMEHDFLSHYNEIARIVAVERHLCSSQLGQSVQETLSSTLRSVSLRTCERIRIFNLRSSDKILDALLLWNVVDFVSQLLHDAYAI